MKKLRHCHPMYNNDKADRRAEQLHLASPRLNLGSLERTLYAAISAEENLTARCLVEDTGLALRCTDLYDLTVSCTPANHCYILSSTRTVTIFV